MPALFACLFFSIIFFYSFLCCLPENKIWQEGSGIDFKLLLPTSAQQLKEHVWILMNVCTSICIYCSVWSENCFYFFSPCISVSVSSLFVSLPSVEISAIKLAREQQVAQARRKATPVVGDMRPLADALPELSQLLPSFKTSGSARRKNKV